MADTNYVLDLIIQAQNNATTELNKIGDNIDAIKNRSVKMSETTKKTLKTIGVTATAVTASVVALWKSFIDASIENEPIQKSFERLSESANIASDEMLKAMRKASRWTVNDTKLMSAANKAYSLWIVQSADDMATMMEIARVKGQAMWRTMEEALDDIVTWLWRWSAQILDNLWIVVKSSDAYEKYANSIWKAVGELTEEEKKLALVNAVVSQWKEELEAFGEVPLTMAERVAQLNTARENTQNTIGDALVPVFKKLLNVIQPIIDKIADFVSNHAELVANVMIWIGAFSWLTAVLSWIALALPWLSVGVAILTNKRTLLTAAVTAVRWALNRLEDAVVSTDEKVAIYKKWIEDLKQKLDLWEISQEEFTKAVEEYNQKINEAYAESNTFTQFMKNQFDQVLKVMTFDTDTRREAMESFWIIFNEVWWMFDRVAAFLWETGISVWKWFWETVDEVWSFFDRLAAILWTTVISAIDKVMEKISSFIKKMKDMIETAREAMSVVWWKISWAFSSATSYVSWLFWKAWWWVVQGGETYLVWEHGPELFTPSQSGRITPNNQITNNNGSVSININSPVVRSDDDIQRITDEIIRQIKLEKQFGIA